MVKDIRAMLRPRVHQGLLRPWQAYLFTVAVTAFTLTLRLGFDVQLQGAPTLIILTLPIMLAARAGGLRTGFFATALAYFGASYFLLPPFYTLTGKLDSGPSQQILFVVTGVAISWIVEALHIARRKAELATLEHQQAKDALQKSETDQRQLARSLEAQTARLLAAQSVSKTGSWETDLVTMEVSWSDETHRIFEMDPDSYSPTHEKFLDFAHPDDRLRVDTAFADSIGKEGIHAIEHRILMHDGRIKFVEERWQAFYDDTGRAMKAVGTCQDITERKSAELVLDRQQAEVRALFDLMPAMVWFKDTQNRILRVNERVAQLAGLSVEEIEGRDSQEIYPENAARFFADDLDVIRSGMPKLGIVEPLVAADGTNMWMRTDKVPYSDKNGKVIGIVVMAQDITHQRRIEESLRLQAHMLDSVGQAVIATDLEGRITYANHFVETLYGWPPREIEGRNIFDTTVASDGRAEAEQIMSQLQQGNKWSGEFRVRRRNGTEFPASVTNTPLIDNHGELIGIVGVSEDISLRNKAQEELRSSVVEISRKNRALKMLSQCNDVLVRAENENELLHQICQIAVEHGGYRMAWVGYALHDEFRTIKPQTHAGAEDGYLTEIKLSWNEGEPSGRGPGGTIIRTGKPVVCEDISADLSCPWGPAATLRGYRGFIGLPLRGNDETFGLLALYSDVKDVSSSSELALLRELADNVAFGIGNLRSQLERRRLQLAVTTVAAGVSAATGSEFFEQLAGSVADALGADGAFVAKLLPGAPMTARTIAAMVGGELIENFDYAIAGTPCELLEKSNTCVVVSHVAEQFPQSLRLSALRAQGYVGRRLDSSSGQPLGLLFVVFKGALHDGEFVTSTLQIFAARAASELERQQTDIQLREQAALLDIAREAIQVKDLEGRVRYWNKGSERTYGWTADEVIGREFVELLPGDRRSSETAHASALAKGEWQGELVRHTKDGREITVDARWTLVRDNRGNPKSILSIDTDITEKKHLEAQLHRSQRIESIGTLAGGIAHDLNNVLAPILMSVDTLMDVVKEKDDLALLATLRGSAQRGADLVKQVLSFARGMDGQRVPVCLTQVGTELLTVIRDTFPKSVQVCFREPQELWEIRGDPTQMHQVMLNLCVNARDAMTGGGLLTLSIENTELTASSPVKSPDCRPGRYVRISVTDTGTGICPLDLDRIFDPFFTTKDLNGTGLGLSTSMAIVKSHGGFMQVKSAAGSGSTFDVYLPAATVPAEAQLEPVDEPATTRGNGELILVVDDEEAIRKVSRRLLERFGYRVLLAGNGEEAVALYERHGSDIAAVLTDMAMPIMDGAATIAALRAINPDVIIIASSGFSSNETVPPAVGRTVQHFISKPYTAQAMFAIIGEALNGYAVRAGSEREAQFL